MARKLASKKTEIRLILGLLITFLGVLMAAGLVSAQTPTPDTAAPTLTPTPADSAEASVVIPTAIAHPAADGVGSCFECHIDLGDKQTEIAEKWQASVHGKAGIGCADCHGGDPRTDEMNMSMAPEAGFIGIPPRLVIPNICGGCHSNAQRMGQYNLATDQYAKYMTSVHGAKLEHGDTRVAICTDCHGTHDVKEASDPSADVYPLNVPDLCARCHSDTSLMESYGIPTNQYETYAASVHGEALLTNRDVRAPTCASCHGSHGAKPPTSAEVVNVCGKCHTATQEYYQESLHSRIGDNAPKCWTCHGNHDIFRPDESMFVHPKPPEERHCGTCHMDDQSFRMDKSRFALREDRRCDTCHHEGSMIMAQVAALRTALTNADAAYRKAEETIKRAKSRGMIVTEAEAKLTEAYTSLVSARAVLHTTKLPRVTELTEAAVASATAAEAIASSELGENFIRRQAMIVSLSIIGLIVATLSAVKHELYKQLQ